MLFVCVSNAGKSQMAAALIRQLATQQHIQVQVHSAGTRPGTTLNAESVAAAAEVGADMSGHSPHPVDSAVLARADRVIVLGTAAHLPPALGMRAPGIEVWDTDEPSARGIQGQERMRLIRDDIHHRCQQLLNELRTTARHPDPA